MSGLQLKLEKLNSNTQGLEDKVNIQAETINLKDIDIEKLQKTVAGYRDRNGNERDELSQTMDKSLNVINGLKTKIS